MTQEKTRRLVLHPVREILLRALESADDVAVSTIDVVSGSVRGALARARNGGSSPAAAVLPVVLGATRGALESGADLALAMKGVFVGLRTGGRDHPETFPAILLMAARTAIHHLALAGGDVTGATAGLLAGAVQGALDFGEDVHRAAEAAAQGAVEGAEEAGFESIHQVHVALGRPLPGLNALLVPLTQPKEPS